MRSFKMHRLSHWFFVLSLAISAGPLAMAQHEYDLEFTDQDTPSSLEDTDSLVIQVTHLSKGYIDDKLAAEQNREPRKVYFWVKVIVDNGEEPYDDDYESTTVHAFKVLGVPRSDMVTVERDGKEVQIQNKRGLLDPSASIYTDIESESFLGGLFAKYKVGQMNAVFANYLRAHDARGPKLRFQLIEIESGKVIAEAALDKDDFRRKLSHKKVKEISQVNQQLKGIEEQIAKKGAEVKKAEREGEPDSVVVDLKGELEELLEKQREKRALLSGSARAMEGMEPDGRDSYVPYLRIVLKNSRGEGDEAQAEIKIRNLSGAQLAFDPSVKHAQDLALDYSKTSMGREWYHWIGVTDRPLSEMDGTEIGVAAGQGGISVAIISSLWRGRHAARPAKEALKQAIRAGNKGGGLWRVSGRVVKVGAVIALVGSTGQKFIPMIWGKKSNMLPWPADKEPEAVNRNKSTEAKPKKKVN